MTWRVGQSFHYLHVFLYGDMWFCHAIRASSALFEGVWTHWAILRARWDIWTNFSKKSLTQMSSGQKWLNLKFFVWTRNGKCGKITSGLLTYIQGSYAIKQFRRQNRKWYLSLWGMCFFVWRDWIATNVQFSFDRKHNPKKLNKQGLNLLRLSPASWTVDQVQSLVICTGKGKPAGLGRVLVTGTGMGIFTHRKPVPVALGHGSTVYWRSHRRDTVT